MVYKITNFRKISRKNSKNSKNCKICKINRMFQNFGMFLSKKLNPPKNKCFSSNNLYLCDDSNFLKKFKTDQGFAYYYFQDVIHEQSKEKWLVIPSYFTLGCWKTLIYECWIRIWPACENRPRRRQKNSIILSFFLKRSLE